MTKPKNNLEWLVNQLESALATSLDVKIELNKRLRDKQTGKLREHDVVVTIKQKHHEVLIAMECRDRSRPVGVEAIEAFNAKCQNTGVNQGAIVSGSGFCNTARMKAALYGIRCLDMKTATNFDWLLPKQMLQQKCKVTKRHFECIPVADPEHKPKRFNLIAPDGNEIPINILIQNLAPHIEKIAPMGTKPGKYSGAVFFNTPNCKIRDIENNQEIELRCINAEFEVEVEAKLVEIELFNYSEKTTIGQIAVVPCEGGVFEGKLVFAHSPTEGTKVSYVLEKPKSDL